MKKPSAKNTRDKTITIRKKLPGGGSFPMTISNPDYVVRESPVVARPLPDEAMPVSVTAATFDTSSVKANLPPMADRMNAVREAYAWIGPERIIVINDDPMMKTQGGIDIPDQHLQRPTSGAIALMGEEVEAKTNGHLKVGVRVIYAVYAGTAIDFRGWNMRIMKWTEAEVALADGVDAFQGVIK